MKTARDVWLIFERSMGITLRNPVWVGVSLAQPVFFLVLFGPLLTSVNAPGYASADAFDLFVPGLLIQMGLFGALFVGFSLLADVRHGVIDRMRVTPVSRLAMLLGRACRDVTVLVVQAVLLVAAAIPLGLHADPLGMVMALALVALTGLVMVCASYALALRLRSEDALGPLLNSISIPLLLLSGILLPLSLAPTWLRWLSSVNPLRYAVDAARDLAAGHLASLAVVRGLVVMGALAVLTLWISTRSFTRSAG